MQLESLPTLVAGIWTDENTLQLEATTQFRKLLSIGKTSISFLYLVSQLFVLMITGSGLFFHDHYLFLN